MFPLEAMHRTADTPMIPSWSTTLFMKMTRRRRAPANSKCSGTWWTMFSRNNIVYAGSRCLLILNKSQIDKNTPPAIIDHNLYYCASGAQASRWAGPSNIVTGFDTMLRLQAMTVILIFRIRVSSIQPRMTSIYNPTLPRSLLGQLTTFRREFAFELLAVGKPMVNVGA